MRIERPNKTEWPWDQVMQEHRRCHHLITLDGRVHNCKRARHHEGLHDAFEAANDGGLAVW